jgi:molybdopterin converting factor small subunit
MFFAGASQAMGCREKEIFLPANATVGDAFDLLARECSQLQALSASCALAVQGKLVDRTTMLHDGCTFAILPPVSGG